MPSFSDLVLAWYEKHARTLPWRGHPDSYAIWVSEIMLQQTRVETVIPYFERWMRLFPGIAELAAAPEGAVLSAWEGLGYYSRARNLHRAARMVVTEFGGELPREISELRRLPGIGRYTAAAIASIAFGQDVASMDANLRRIIARVFDVALPADSPVGEELLWRIVQENLPVGRAADYNQALMDLGASICLARKPLCLLCPLAEVCQSRADPENRPVLKPKRQVPHRIKMAAVVVRDGAVLLAQHPSHGLLGGLWEFPASEVEENTPEALVRTLAASQGLNIRPIIFLAEIRHAYTHFTLAEFAWRCELQDDNGLEGLRWVPIVDLKNHPMGKVDRTIAGQLS